MNNRLDIKFFKNQISNDDVIKIMSLLGCYEHDCVQEGLVFHTICHNKNCYEGKKKLYYYYNSKQFHCYTNCGHIGDIFSIIQHIRKCTFKEAKSFLLSQLNIKTQYTNRGVKDEEYIDQHTLDHSFIRSLTIKNRTTDIINPPIQENVLEDFWNLYHESWLEDFISIETMKKFNIKFDIVNYRIIIPVFDENSKLIGIRCRNLEDKEASFSKYSIVAHKGIVYGYQRSYVLYGLNFNKEVIRQTRQVIIGESEKFVLQHGTFYKNSNAVGLGGSTISKQQTELLLKENVEEVVLALDKEFLNSQEEINYANKIEKDFVKKLQQFFKVSVIWDKCNLIDYKMSPTDKGKEVFDFLYQHRLKLS